MTPSSWFDWLSIIFGVVGVVALIITLWARNNPRTDADVRFEVRCDRLASRGDWSGAADSITIRFDAQPVDFVDEVQVAFRNFGPARLNLDDVEEPIRVHLGDGRRVLAVEGDHAREVQPGVVEVAVTPLLDGESRTVRILHDVPDLATDDVTVTGALRNVPKGILRERGASLEEVRDQSSNIQMVAILAAIFAGCIALCVDFAYLSDERAGWHWALKLGTVALGPFIILLLGLVLLMSPIAATTWLLDRPIQMILTRHAANRSPFGGP